jgi:hypothetical protein
MVIRLSEWAASCVSHLSFAEFGNSSGSVSSVCPKDLGIAQSES